MKTKILTALSIASIFSVALFSTVSAQGIGAAIDVETSASVNVGNVDANAQANVNANASSTGPKSKNVDGETKGEVSAEAHRSNVAVFVQSLLNVANRDGGIGVEVREIAQMQNDSASTTASTMVKVDERGGVKKFFLGADYKNLGIIRSELATTSNNIIRLKAVLERTTDAAARAELSAQIQALETEKANVEAYVESHENVFSLFGWFVKLFVSSK